MLILTTRPSAHHPRRPQTLSAVKSPPQQSAPPRPSPEYTRRVYPPHQSTSPHERRPTSGYAHIYRSQHSTDPGGSPVPVSSSPLRIGYLTRHQGCRQMRTAVRKRGRRTVHLDPKMDLRITRMRSTIPTEFHVGTTTISHESLGLSDEGCEEGERGSTLFHEDPTESVAEGMIFLPETECAC